MSLSVNNINNKSENKMLIKISNVKSEENANNNNINKNNININDNPNYQKLTQEEKELYLKQTELLSQIKALEEKLQFEKEQHKYLIESKQEEIEYKTKIKKFSSK